ncbi:hypothetical protein [Mesorhizobium sp. L-2-11]|uniref:hypothetical protein n=1 Tax=Mesorhizobium sp. L-2-11 TaxID=2744521 RepID=UPI0019253499|nr:hypothetical protein [Mesorhizobium sp. L-2-11]BCH14952.1 hypothetical protein MesoLjLa_18030 [Mesorhizobium sp. L-2-11]
MTDRKDYEVTVTSPGRKDSSPEWERRLYSIAERLDACLGVRFWTIAGLVLVSLVAGTPHILVQYQCYGRCGPTATELNCQYYGIRGWKTAEPSAGKCQRIRLL